MQENNIEYFTYTQRGCLPKNIVLKGLNKEFNAEGVKTAIMDMNLENINIIKIGKMVSRRATREKGATVYTDNFIVQLTPDSDIKQLSGIKILLYQTVYWQSLRKPKMFQCFR